LRAGTLCNRANVPHVLSVRRLIGLLRDSRRACRCERNRQWKSESQL